MPQEEIYGTRNRAYSAWHRRLSTRRFISIEDAQLLAMIDMDASLYVEYDDQTKEPLALIETAVDNGQTYKPATVTRNLAKRVIPRIVAFIVLYKLSPNWNPADKNWHDIESFRVKMIWPIETRFYQLSPEQWAKKLLELRRLAASELDADWLSKL